MLDIRTGKENSKLSTGIIYASVRNGELIVRTCGPKSQTREKHVIEHDKITESLCTRGNNQHLMPGMSNIWHKKGGAYYIRPGIDGELIVKQEGVTTDKHIIRNGEQVESLRILGARKEHWVAGTFEKIYERGALVYERYFRDDWEMLYKGKFLRKVEKEYTLERYSDHGDMVREVVYWSNGQQMYDIHQQDKDICVFDEHGLPLSKITLATGLSLDNKLLKPIIDLSAIVHLTARFPGEWYYETYYCKSDWIFSWMKGREFSPEEGFKCGEYYYFIRGIRVPEHIAQGQYGAADILNYPNETVRNELLRRHGLARLARELHGQTLDKNETYELIRFPVPHGTVPDTVLKVLKMRCPSTQKWHFLRVPPQCNNINEALNWTYGIRITDTRSARTKLEMITET